MFWIAPWRPFETLRIPELNPDLVALALAGQRPTGGISGDLRVAYADNLSGLLSCNVVVYARHDVILGTGPSICKVF